MQVWMFIGIWSNCLKFRGKDTIIMSLFWLQTKHKKIISIHCAGHWDLEMSKAKQSVHSPIIQWSVGERGKKFSNEKRKSAGDLWIKKYRLILYYYLIILYKYLLNHAYFYLVKQFIEKLLSGLIRVLILRQCISLLMVYPDVCKFT